MQLQVDESGEEGAVIGEEGGVSKDIVDGWLLEKVAG